MDIINEYLEETRSVVSLSSETQFLKVRPHIVCADGFRVSVQAGQYLYSRPRLNDGPYSAVELGYPSAEEPDLVDWAEDADRPTDTVYAYVPIEVVAAVIQKHGGIDREATLAAKEA